MQFVRSWNGWRWYDNELVPSMLVGVLYQLLWGFHLLGMRGWLLLWKRLDNMLTVQSWDVLVQLCIQLLHRLRSWHVYPQLWVRVVRSVQRRLVQSIFPGIVMHQLLWRLLQHCCWGLVVLDMPSMLNSWDIQPKWKHRLLPLPWRHLQHECTCCPLHGLSSRSVQPERRKCYLSGLQQYMQPWHILRRRMPSMLVVLSWELCCGQRK